ncbi:hypothetical protein IP88_12720 [alpha proteobacterium AAP81b]|nr:hypothetical protein IP88_12720 [alpha proteobacterium AAP81b]
MRFVLAGLLIFAAIPAAAADLPADLLKCAGTARDAERLACYDAAVAAVSAEARAIAGRRAAESARIAAEEKAAADAAAKARAEREAAERAVRKKADFGAEAIASRAEEVRKERAVGEIEEIEAGLSEVLTGRTGLAVFVLDNGQLWRQVDTQSLPNARPGDRVKVERATLGGYNLVLLKQKRRFLVRRMR